MQSQANQIYYQDIYIIYIYITYIIYILYIYIYIIYIHIYIYISSLDAHLYICLVHWCVCLMGQFSRTKNLADWDEGLFTRMSHYLFLLKVVLIPSEKQKTDRGYVKYMF